MVAAAAFTAADTLLVLTHFIAAALQLSVAFDLMYSIQQMLDIVQDERLVLEAHCCRVLGLRFLLRWLDIVDDMIIDELDQIQDQTLEEQGESRQLKRHCRWLQQSAQIADDDLQQILVLFLAWRIGEKTA